MQLSSKILLGLVNSMAFHSGRRQSRAGGIPATAEASPPAGGTNSLLRGPGWGAARSSLFWMGFNWFQMGFNWFQVGFNWDLMGSYWDLMGFNWDLMGFSWLQVGFNWLQVDFSMEIHGIWPTVGML